MKLVSIGEAEKSCAKANYKFDGNKVFFTSDTHFYHGNIIRFCNRPFKNVEMKNMEVRKICQWCGKPLIAQKTTTCYCSPQCSKRVYKHRIKERKMELRHIQEMQESRSSLEKQEYFTFSQAARLMGVCSQYIYKLVK